MILDWIKEKNFEYEIIKLYENQSLPEIDSFDFLIIMGGPMSIHDEAKYSWLKAEKSFIKSAIDAGKKVLGICLGAQLIAVLGAVLKRAVKTLR